MTAPEEAPRCRTCGCQDLRYVSSRPLAVGRLFVRRLCRHCGRQQSFTETDPTAAPEERALVNDALRAWHCPSCGANFPRITSTQGQLRYARCRLCGTVGKVPVVKTPAGRAPAKRKTKAME